MIDELRSKLGKNKVLTGQDVQERYSHIWTMDQPLAAKAVILPHSTEDVSMALKICHAHQQPVVVHGGLTNLVGGTKTQRHEIVIALEKMDRIEEIDPQSRTMTVQSGVILENIHQTAESENLLFPLSFGAKGSAQIGGVISANAGGLRVFRYGVTRQLILGIEAVLADGTVINSLKKIIKDNSAYDLKQLFIGSEGTLGIITRAVLKLVEAPRSRTSAYVGINDYTQVISFLKFMDKSLAGTLSAFELIWKKTYHKMTTAGESNPPLPYDYEYYVLVETLGQNQTTDQHQLIALLEKAIDQKMILDAVPAQSKSDLDWFWKIREDVRVISASCTVDQHFDVSLPIPLIGDYAANTIATLEKMDGVNHCYTFGHMADGNIHLVIDKVDHSDQLRMAIDQVVYSPLQAMGGSISAEHGIGEHKKAYLKLSRSPEEIELMRRMKKMMDPLGILNMGKVL